MKIRFIYEAGREPKVRRIVEEADILSHLDEINGSRKQDVYKRQLQDLCVVQEVTPGLSFHSF